MAGVPRWWLASRFRRWTPHTPGTPERTPASRTTVADLAWASCRAAASIRWAAAGGAAGTDRSADRRSTVDFRRQPRKREFLHHRCGQLGQSAPPPAQIAESRPVGTIALLPLAQGFVHGSSLFGAEKLVRLVELMH